MTTPKPSASFGRWRHEEIRVAGQRVRPATYNESDRALIDQRVLSKSRDRHETTTDDRTD
ncbi:hypothetical protein [Pseudonocardia sp. D17]|uniref:hypothetical protein n=1 Tax=Pseudonocardia sp. D17 TaxID=882661 RepID=UPI002B3D8A19|nr:hypothetical protein PSD17_66540 [Pseudonocardia sp. D17]